MVEPLDERGIRPLTRLRPVSKEERADRRRKRPRDAEPAPEPAPTARESRIGRNIDERC